MEAQDPAPYWRRTNASCPNEVSLYEVKSNPAVVALIVDESGQCAGSYILLAKERAWISPSPASRKQGPMIANPFSDSMSQKPTLPMYKDYDNSHRETSRISIDSRLNDKLESLLSELSARLTATQTGKHLSTGTTFYACTLSGPNHTEFGLGVLKAPGGDQLVQWAEERVFSFDRAWGSRAIDKITNIVRSAPESTVASWLDQLQHGAMENRVFTLDLEKPQTSFKSDTGEIGYERGEKSMLEEDDEPWLLLA